MVITTNKVIINVPVMHYLPDGAMIAKEVDFEISRKDHWFKAMPLMSKKDRLAAGLPEELAFIYTNQCITAANDMEEDTLNAIKQIILELEVQELL